MRRVLTAFTMLSIFVSASSLSHMVMQYKKAPESQKYKLMNQIKLKVAKMYKFRQKAVIAQLHDIVQESYDTPNTAHTTQETMLAKGNDSSRESRGSKASSSGQARYTKLAKTVNLSKANPLDAFSSLRSKQIRAILASKHTAAITETEMADIESEAEANIGSDHDSSSDAISSISDNMHDNEGDAKDDTQDAADDTKDSAHDTKDAANDAKDAANDAKDAANDAKDAADDAKDNIKDSANNMGIGIDEAPPGYQVEQTHQNNNGSVNASPSKGDK